MVCWVSGCHAFLPEQKKLHATLSPRALYRPHLSVPWARLTVREGREGRCTHGVCGLVVSLCKLCVGMAGRAFGGHLHAGSAAVVTAPALETQNTRAGQTTLMRTAEGLPVFIHVGTVPPTPVGLLPFYTTQAPTPSPWKYFSSPTGYFSSYMGLFWPGIRHHLT